MPEKAPRNGVPEKDSKDDIPGKAPRNDVPERAPRNGVPEGAPRNGVPERIPKIDIPEKAPGSDVPERAPRNGMLERVPRNGISEGAPKKGVPERASKNGVSERAPYVAVESVIFHQLPTSVTLRSGRATFVSVIPATQSNGGSRLCLTRTAPALIALGSRRQTMHAVLLFLLPFRPSHRLPLLLLPLFTVPSWPF